MGHEKSRDLHLVFQLHNCLAWHDAEDLFECIKTVLRLGNLLPLENRSTEIEGGRRDQPVAEEIGTWFMQNYRQNQAWDEDSFDRMYPKEEFTCSFRTTLEPEWHTEAPLFGAIEIQCEAERFGATYNFVEFSCLLHGKTLLRNKPVLPYTLNRADDITQLLLQFAAPLIKHLKPAYAIIGDGRDHGLISYGQQVLDVQIQAIHWCNFFGPTYLKKYGEELFLTAPHWKVQEIENGIWYIVTKQFSEFTEHFSQTKPHLERQVLEHFTRVSINKVG